MFCKSSEECDFYLLYPGFVMLVVYTKRNYTILSSLSYFYMNIGKYDRSKTEVCIGN